MSPLDQTFDWHSSEYVTEKRNRETKKESDKGRKSREKPTEEGRMETTTTTKTPVCILHATQGHFAFILIVFAHIDFPVKHQRTMFVWILNTCTLCAEWWTRQGERSDLKIAWQEIPRREKNYTLTQRERGIVEKACHITVIATAYQDTSVFTITTQHRKRVWSPWKNVLESQERENNSLSQHQTTNGKKIRHTQKTDFKIGLVKNNSCYLVNIINQIRERNNNYEE